MKILSSFAHDFLPWNTKEEILKCWWPFEMENLQKRSGKEVSTFLLLCSSEEKVLSVWNMIFFFIFSFLNDLCIEWCTLSTVYHSAAPLSLSHHEEMLVVLDEHQGDGDDDSAVFYAQSLRTELSL